MVRTNPFEGGSDHTPFLTFKKPGVLFWHFTDQFYHTDGDRIDKVSAATLQNVGISALVSALVLTTADGGTARAVVDDLEHAAIARLDVEVALSRAAIAAGGAAAREREILQTWIDYYVNSLATIADVETGGSSAETAAAIARARKRVSTDGAAKVASLKQDQ